VSSKRVRALLDRFEGDKAVLLLGEKESQTVVWPRAFLPPDAVQGMVLEVIVETDPEAAADMTDEIRRLLDDLSGPV